MLQLWFILLEMNTIYLILYTKINTSYEDRIQGMWGELSLSLTYWKFHKSSLI